MAEGLEARRKRARWRAGHRGVRELDLVLGRFAETDVARMDEEELAAFEQLLDESDANLQDWILGGGAAPAGHDRLLAAIRALRFAPADFKSR